MREYVGVLPLMEGNMSVIKYNAELAAYGPPLSNEGLVRLAILVETQLQHIRNLTKASGITPDEFHRIAQKLEPQYTNEGMFITIIAEHADRTVIACSTYPDPIPMPKEGMH